MRFNVEKSPTLSGKTLTFISKYDCAIDWASTGYSPDHYESARWSSDVVSGLRFHDGQAPAPFLVHAPSQRELSLAFALAGVDFKESEGISLAGTDGEAAKNFALAEVSLELGRLCCDDCPEEKGLVEKTSYRRCERVTDEALKKAPWLEKILQEIGLALLIHRGNSLPSS